MKVKSMVTFEEGYMSEQFVFGGTKRHEECGDKKYTYFITNYLIDTGDEVILVDTSFPDHITELPVVEELGIFTGRRIKTFEEALNNVGYKVSDVDKIILTHNNIDHTGAIDLFPNAEIYITDIDKADLQSGDGLNIKAVNLEDGELKNFKGIYEVTKNIYMVKAYGHTKGHAIVVAYDENRDDYYLFAGDMTVADEALIENEVILAHEDLESAKITLDEVREFVKNNKTVYLSTHDPKSIESLAKRKYIIQRKDN